MIRIIAAVLVVAGCLALLGAGEGKGSAPGEKGAEKGKHPLYKPVAPLLVVMENVDELLASSWKKIDKKEFKKLKKEAQFLSELLNVACYHKPNKDWITWSLKCRDQLLELASQSEKVDEKALKGAFDAIDSTCSSCHEKYRD